MDNERLSVRQWLVAFNNGEFDGSDREVQCRAGWFDWFCREKSLAGKTKTLGAKIKKIARSPKIDQDKMYVVLRNSCPMVGNLFDNIRFCRFDDDGVVYTIIPRRIINGVPESSVWGKENDFDGPLVVGNWKGILAWFGV